MILLLSHWFHGCFFKPVFIVALTILTTVFEFFPLTASEHREVVLMYLPKQGGFRPDVLAPSWLRRGPAINSLTRIMNSIQNTNTGTDQSVEQHRSRAEKESEDETDTTKDTPEQVALYTINPPSNGSVEG